jgi:hypothetical protein
MNGSLVRAAAGKHDQARHAADALCSCSEHLRRALGRPRRLSDADPE